MRQNVINGTFSLSNTLSMERFHVVARYLVIKETFPCSSTLSKKHFHAVTRYQCNFSMQLYVTKETFICSSTLSLECTVARYEKDIMRSTLSFPSKSCNVYIKAGRDLPSNPCSTYVHNFCINDADRLR